MQFQLLRLRARPPRPTQRNDGIQGCSARGSLWSEVQQSASTPSLMYYSARRPRTPNSLFRPQHVQSVPNLVPRFGSASATPSSARKVHFAGLTEMKASWLQRQSAAGCIEDSVYAVLYHGPLLLIFADEQRMLAPPSMRLRASSAQLAQDWQDAIRCCILLAFPANEEPAAADRQTMRPFTPLSLTARSIASSQSAGSLPTARSSWGQAEASSFGSSEDRAPKAPAADSELAAKRQAEDVLTFLERQRADALLLSKRRKEDTVQGAATADMFKARAEEDASTFATRQRADLETFQKRQHEDALHATSLGIKVSDLSKSDSVQEASIENGFEHAVEEARMALDSFKLAAAAAASGSDVAASNEASRGESTAEDDAVDVWSAKVWTQSLPIHELLANAIRAPIEHLVANESAASASAAELAFVRALAKSTPAQVETLVNRALPHISNTFANGAKALHSSSATGSELSSKFADEGELQLGGLDAFNAGIGGVVGLPNPKLQDAMQREHCESVDSDCFFEAGNYGVRTKSWIEWWFVVDPDEGHRRLGDGVEFPSETRLAMRKRRYKAPLSSFDSAMAQVNAVLRNQEMPALRRQELISARLYTGPTFVKYNAVMRGAHQYSPAPYFIHVLRELCQGNAYTTTIWAINSTILKLSKLTVADKVYRGIQGRTLPEMMRRRDENKIIGGVDFAFLSTTRDREVAMSYAGRSSSVDQKKFGMVFEIQQGLIDRGADLSWLSQYPFEKEILFAPLTGLEVMSTRVEGTILVVEISPTVNQSAETIDAVISKLQRSHLQFLDLLVEEFQRAGAPSGSLKPLQALKASAKMRAPSWFNQVANLKQAMDAALIAKHDVMRVLRYEPTWNASEDDVDLTQGKSSDSAEDGMDDSTDTSQILRERQRAEEMYLAAELCAQEGNPDAAINMLELSLAACQKSHPRVREPTDLELVEDVMRTLEVRSQTYRDLSDAGTSSWVSSFNMIAKGKGSKPCKPNGLRVADTIAEYVWIRSRLLLLHILLATGAVSPWPRTIIDLTSSDIRLVRGLCELLQRHKLVHEEPFKLDCRVLALTNDDEWLEGSIIDINDDDATHRTWRYKVRLPLGDELYTLRALPFGEGGAGELLRAAADMGRSDVVEALLRIGVSVHEASLAAETAMHLAAMHTTRGHVEVCRVLTEYGGDGFLVSSSGYSPHDRAVMRQAPQIIHAINPRDEDIEIQACLTSTTVPMPKLVVYANDSEDALLQAVAMLGVPADAAIVNAKGANGVTALMVACKLGFLEGVRALLRAGASLTESTSEKHCTALGMAISEGAVKIVKLIVMWARAKGMDEDAPARIVNQGNESQHAASALIRAAQGGFVDIGRILIDARADIDAPGLDAGRTPLVCAARNGHADFVRLLVEADADATLQGLEEGLTCLASACKFGHVHIIEELGVILDRDVLHALVLQPDRMQQTPLHLATRFGHDQVVRTLLQLGAPVNLIDARGDSALAIACARGHRILMPNLVDARADINCTNHVGLTPLMLCCMHGHRDAAQLLTFARADVHKVDARSSQQTALMLACRCGSCQVRAFPAGGRGRPSQQFAERARRKWLHGSDSRCGPWPIDCRPRTLTSRCRSVDHGRGRAHCNHEGIRARG